ncbi:PRD domain-containing protein [Lacrimispora amygdalina]|uniref:PRD domain-containing protein n=1 Tax=Lacrimispora amygdalina TaxID=253257 RepID=A0A3E2N5N5_9FIRM|nr:PRD domain-containing protein [Clostridium indicum]RFZ76201.1 PRD domain-containing protein [Clostridium indicum]
MNYRVKKIYNNNIILAEDDKMSEVILLGKGIAFQKQIGDIVDIDKIDKKFIFESPETYSKYITLLKEIPLNQVELANKIIEQAQEELEVTFHDSIYIGLTDHISYTISRYKTGLAIKNALLWEIRNYYPKEYQAAKNSLNLIRYYEKIYLSDDEIGFIALHFINAQQNGEEIKQTMAVAEIEHDVLNLVKYHYQIELNEDTLNYSRFVTHIRFFARRLLKKEIFMSEDNFLYDQIKVKMPHAKACADKVKDYFIKKYNITISQEEMIYFMLHINRVAEREIKESRNETR